MKWRLCVNFWAESTGLQRRYSFACILDFKIFETGLKYISGIRFNDSDLFRENDDSRSGKDAILNFKNYLQNDFFVFFHSCVCCAWVQSLQKGLIWLQKFSLQNWFINFNCRFSICGVAQLGAPWLSWVRRDSVGCGVAQLVARGTLVARVRFPARHPREVHCK